MKYNDFLNKVIGTDSLYKGRSYPIYLINYTDESIGLYDKLGFKISCEIGKLYAVE